MSRSFEKDMPPLLSIHGFKFKFYSNENQEPPNVHVVKGNAGQNGGCSERGVQHRVQSG